MTPALVIVATIVVLLLFKFFGKNNPKVNVLPTNDHPPIGNSNPNRKTIFSKIAGVTHANEDGTARQQIIASRCKAGLPLTLIAEPENPHDKNAIAIFLNGTQLGYIQAGRLADELSEFINCGIAVSAEIAKITGGPAEQKSFGVNIAIHIDKKNP
jgi:hypothetical protein